MSLLPGYRLYERRLEHAVVNPKTKTKIENVKQKPNAKLDKILQYRMQNKTVEWPVQIIPKIHVIHIPTQSISTVRHYAKHWKQFLSPFDGTDGRKINKKKWLEEKHINDAGYRGLTRGQIGCADSHYRLWKRISESAAASLTLKRGNQTYELPYFEMVAEHDFAFVPRAETRGMIEDTLIELLETGTEWDLLYLEYRNVFGKPPKRLNVTQWTFEPTGCQCLYTYLLTSKGAAKLIAGGAKPFHRPIDMYVASLTDSGKLKALCLDPPIGVTRNILSTTTSIR